MIFNERNDPNQISKLIEFESRDGLDHESEYSYNSVSDLDIGTNQIRNKSKNNQNNTQNSFSSQLSEYAIQKSFHNDNLQDKSDGDESDCSINFQSRKADYSIKKNSNYKTIDEFATKNSFMSQNPSSDNFCMKNILSEKYVAPKTNRLMYTKEDYISDKNEIDKMFKNSKVNLINNDYNMHSNNTNKITNGNSMKNLTNNENFTSNLNWNYESYKNEGTESNYQTNQVDNNFNNDYNHMIENNELVENEMDIINDIKILPNASNDEYYLNYDSDPK